MFNFGGALEVIAHAEARGRGVGSEVGRPIYPLQFGRKTGRNSCYRGKDFRKYLEAGSVRRKSRLDGQVRQGGG
jgi:hypothetical protein